MTEDRIDHELEHGRKLSGGGAEDIWGWGSPAGLWRAARRGKLIAETATLGPGKTVLEIGCGTGLFTTAFAETGAHVVAVELSPELIERARSRGLPESHVRFLTSDFMTADLNLAFDAVLGSSVLHHLDIEAALRRILELLKPGAVMAFAEPNMMNPQIYMERHFRRFFPAVSPDETAFVRGSLSRLMMRCGFEDVKISPFDWLHPAVPRPLIPFVSGIGRVLEIMPVVREFAGSLLITGRRPAGKEI